MHNRNSVLKSCFTFKENIQVKVRHCTTDEDSDLSDVEEQGYCHVSSPGDIRMKLQPVRRDIIMRLYSNTDAVIIACHLYSSAAWLTVVCKTNYL